MSKVFRIFVEKKKGNDIEAGQTLADLRDNVGLSALEDLRIINRYYAQGLTEEEFNLAVKQILSEPNLDNVYTELSIPEDYRYFAMEYLPGQYDQRADSAAQCIQLLTAGERPEVQSAKIIAVKGDITDEEFEKIYQLNKSLSLPVSLDEIEISKEQWEESTDRIPDMSDVAHYPYKVTKEMLKNAMARLEERVRKDNHVR